MLIRKIKESRKEKKEQKKWRHFVETCERSMKTNVSGNR